MVFSTKQKTYTVHGTGSDETTALTDLERAVLATQQAVGSTLTERVNTEYEVTLFAGGKSISSGKDNTYSKAYSSAKRQLPKGKNKVNVTAQFVTVAAEYRLGTEQLKVGAGGGAEYCEKSGCLTDLF
jgi:hypothetical protein